MPNRRKVMKWAGLSMAGALTGTLASQRSMSLGFDTSRQVHNSILNYFRSLPDKPKNLRCLIPDGSQANIKPLMDVLSNDVGIQLSAQVAPVDDINTQMMLLNGSANDHFDLALPATFGIPDLASNGAIQPLTTFANRYEPDDLQQGSLYTLGDYFDDDLYGYQTDGDAYLMFFNRSWLEDPEVQKRYSDKYGRELNVPKTWEELDQQMRFFHAPEKDQYGGALFRTPGYLAWEWWIRFHAKGYYPLTDELDPQINNEAGIKALEELIAASDHLSPGSRSNGLFENWHEYAKGNIYCNIGWGGTQKHLNSAQSNVRGKLLFSPTPGGIMQGKLASVSYFNWGWNYTVPTNAKHPEAGYLVALLGASPYVSTLCVRENGYFDPFREAHYQDQKIQSMYSTDFLSAHRQSMRESIPDFYLTGQSNYMNVLTAYLNRANEGNMKPKDALDAVAKTWRGLNLRYGLENQAHHWQRIKQRYPTTLRQLLI